MRGSVRPGALCKRFKRPLLKRELPSGIRPFGSASEGESAPLGRGGCRPVSTTNPDGHLRDAAVALHFAPFVFAPLFFPFPERPMTPRFRFPIFIIDEDYRSENTSGLGIRALADAIQKEGFEVLGVTSYGDLSQFAQQQSRASAFILSIDDEEFSGNGDGAELDPAVLNLRKFIQEIRFKNADIPIYVYGETRTSQHLPNDILRELHGFIHMFEDTPEFVARHIIREAKSYLDGLAPPFFKALMDYAQDGSYSWHCPGHSGGVAFLKSPVGRMFHQFFGENMLRADVCNAVDELGQLLDHTGPIAESELNAARIFNADHCFFVTNGTSTSNKMVWHHTVAPGDIVVVDRNCHKSILHAITMTGAIPVFLRPTRNHLGIIGPIPKSEFSPEVIREKIAKNPLLKGVDAKKAKPRIMTLTQSTYDGVLYNTETIKGKLDGWIDTLHFDEAWLPHAAFHNFYGSYTRWASIARVPRPRWSTRRSRPTSSWRASRRPRRCWCRTLRT
ncbi:orn/Lys/Arg decarboxylase, major domain-containing protein [Ditylenchus destructor]|nr:orn/Lys/Arg decarboxylase, major domain-containing protein [Ditylenchus destructor]